MINQRFYITLSEFSLFVSKHFCSACIELQHISFSATQNKSVGGECYDIIEYPIVGSVGVVVTHNKAYVEEDNLNFGFYLFTNMRLKVILIRKIWPL